MYKKLAALMCLFLFSATHCSEQVDEKQVVPFPPLLKHFYSKEIEPNKFHVGMLREKASYASGLVSFFLYNHYDQNQNPDFDQIMSDYNNTTFSLNKKKENTFFELRINNYPIAHIAERHVKHLATIDLHYLLPSRNSCEQTKKFDNWYYPQYGGRIECQEYPSARRVHLARISKFEFWIAEKESDKTWQFSLQPCTDGDIDRNNPILKLSSLSNTKDYENLTRSSYNLCSFEEQPISQIISNASTASKQTKASNQTQAKITSSAPTTKTSYINSKEQTKSFWQQPAKIIPISLIILLCVIAKYCNLHTLLFSHIN